MLHDYIKFISYPQMEILALFHDPTHPHLKVFTCKQTHYIFSSMKHVQRRFLCFSTDIIHSHFYAAFSSFLPPQLPFTFILLYQLIISGAAQNCFQKCRLCKPSASMCALCTLASACCPGMQETNRKCQTFKLENRKLMFEFVLFLNSVLPSIIMKL